MPRRNFFALKYPATKYPHAEIVTPKRLCRNVLDPGKKENNILRAENV